MKCNTSHAKLLYNTMTIIFAYDKVLEKCSVMNLTINEQYVTSQLSFIAEL